MEHPSRFITAWSNLFDLQHPSNKALEDFVFERLPPTQREVIEEHLLGCARCRDAVTEEESLRRELKPALAAISSRSPRIRLAWSGKAVAWATVFAAGLALLYFVPQKPASPVEVPLASYRGADAGEPVKGPSRRPLRLTLEAPELAPEEAWNLEIVNAVGDRIWTGPIRRAKDRWEASTGKEFPPGQYWVRLYHASGELKKEFSLSLIDPRRY